MPRCGQEAPDQLLREFIRSGSSARCLRSKIMKNWGVIGGAVAALAVGVYVLWGPTSDRRRRRRGMVPGLLNLGNTCFLNALLQGLASCPSFISWLQQLSARGDAHVSGTLLQLLQALSGTDPAGDDLLDAGSLLEALRLYRWHISSFEEQDAHELFHVLTSSLEEERDRQHRVAHLFDVEALEKAVEAVDPSISCRGRGPLHPTASRWRTRHPFHGRLTGHMACRRCQRQSPVRYDSFDSLSLSIPAVQWGRPVTLDQCLQHFISSETIKEVECENCTQKQAEDLNGQVLESQRTTFIKQLKLGKLPQCLCIHLQRLTWSPEGAPIKRHEHVQFSEYLSMDRYKHSAQGPPHRAPDLPNGAAEGREHSRPPPLSPASLGVFPSDPEQSHNNNKPIANGSLASVLTRPPALSRPLDLTYDYGPCEYLFRLTAVLVHHGDTHSGHFVTYRRSPQWLWVSDESVRRASLQEALSSSAYLLFYERVRG